MTVSKTKSSFYRRLYVAWLIDSGTAVSVPAIVEATGMPRRTAQDTLAALDRAQPGADQGGSGLSLSGLGPIDVVPARAPTPPWPSVAWSFVARVAKL